MQELFLIVILILFFLYIIKYIKNYLENNKSKKGRFTIENKSPNKNATINNKNATINKSEILRKDPRRYAYRNSYALTFKKTDPILLNNMKKYDKKSEKCMCWPNETQQFDKINYR
tara:strand:- start:33 stop:380 length:348 start_codon:yes stop_codon:yes gene_type:complete